MKSVKSKKAFTLIELLVVIAIVGLLSTLSIVALGSARSKARDTRRISDVRQMQTALALYYHAYNSYPSSNGAEPAHEALDGIGIGGLGEFIMPTPEAPTPVDGDCSNEENIYMYEQLDGGSSYQLSYCLGNGTNELLAGYSYAAPAYLQMAAEAEPVCANRWEACTINSDCCDNICCAGYCCPPGDHCMMHGCITPL